MEGTADKFIHGELWSGKNPVNVYSNPDSNRLIKIVPSGKYIGTIYSWTKRGDKVWWQLEDNNFVSHESDKFDVPKLLESLVKWNQDEERKLQEAVDKRKADNPFFNPDPGKWFAGLTDGLKQIGLTVLVVVVGGVCVYLIATKK